MKQTFTLLLATCIFHFGTSPEASAATSETRYWPQFRGPNGSGVSADGKAAPVELDADSRLWQLEIPSGHSSPCIWSDHIYLTAYREEQEQLTMLCVDRNGGKILWERPAPPMQKEKRIHKFNNPAAATPAADQDRVVVYYSAFGVVSYDHDGNELWRRALPSPQTKDGTSSSPILYKGLAILQRDGSNGKSEMLALDAATGETKWKTPRPLHQQSYSTPMIWSHDDTEELIVVGNKRLTSYNPSSGEALWWTSGISFQPIGMAVAGDGMLYASSSGTGTGAPNDGALGEPEEFLRMFDRNSDGEITRDEVPKDARIRLRKEVSADTPGNTLAYTMLLFGFFDGNKDGKFTREDWKGYQAFKRGNRDCVMAIRPGGSGDITESHVAWKGSKGISEMPSALHHDGRIYFIRDGGMLSVYHARTGKLILDAERIGSMGQYAASPIASGGLIYACSVSGKVTVLKAGDDLNIVSSSHLRERITATPAIVEGKLYIRTDKHLMAFGESNH